MSRRPNVIPSVKLTIALPEPVHTKLTLYLFSTLENRVPQGAYQQFFCERIEEFFSPRQLDIAPWSGRDPGENVITSSPKTIEILQRTLKGEVPA